MKDFPQPVGSERLILLTDGKQVVPAEAYAGYDELPTGFWDLTALEL